MSWSLTGVFCVSKGCVTLWKHVKEAGQVISPASLIDAEGLQENSF